MNVTIIVPALNEEAYLASTLNSIHAAADYLRRRLAADGDVDIEVIVVDNDSRDGTAAVARQHGATVVHEPVRNIARARNTGARHAAGDLLVFVDADVTVPPALLHGIAETMRDPSCFGGGVDVDYRPRRLVVRLYLHAWRLLGRLTGMVQGATQFCRKSAFEGIGGSPLHRVVPALEGRLAGLVLRPSAVAANGSRLSCRTPCPLATISVVFRPQED